MGYVEKESKNKGCEYELHITSAHAQPNIFDKGGRQIIFLHLKIENQKRWKRVLIKNNRR